MILKIERYPDCEDNQDWWLIDDIRKISKAEFNHPPEKDFDGVESDIFLLDYINYLKYINANVYLDELSDGRRERKVVSLICRLGNGNEFRVLFDTVAYILNDSGKTIEKIVANYR